MEVVVDSREPAELFSAVLDAVSSTGIAIPTRKTMCVGDIRVSHHPSGRHLLIERKTASDLLSSLKDGRWESQRSRMQDGSDHCVYVVESDASPYSDPRTCGAILSLVVRHGVSCVTTSGPSDTAALVSRSVCRMSSDESWPGKPSTLRPRSEAPRAPRSACLCESALLCVPGIGPVVARSVSEHVGDDIGALVLLARSDGGKSRISSVSTGKGRTVGASKASLIVSGFRPPSPGP